MTDYVTQMLNALEQIEAANAEIPLGKVMIAQQDPHLRDLLTTIRDTAAPAIAAARRAKETKS